MLVSVLFALACNSIAHAAHQHEPAKAQLVHAACGYCTSYTGFIDGTTPDPNVQPMVAPQAPDLFDGSCLRTSAPLTSAQARAPPSR